MSDERGVETVPLAAAMTLSNPVDTLRSRLPERSDERAVPELAELLHAHDPAVQNAAWERLVSGHSRLLLHVAGRIMRDQDAVMDGYGHVLERLRQDDYRILRGYVPAAGCQFSTWLAVIARRICVDLHRQRYGRSRGERDDQMAVEHRAARQRLMDLVGVPLDLTQIVDASSRTPESRLRAAQLQAAMDTALDALAPADRLLLKLRFEDDMSAGEIAPILDMPTPFHVYRRLRAVCNSLRRTLTAAGVDGSEP